MNGLLRWVGSGLRLRCAWPPPTAAIVLASTFALSLGCGSLTIPTIAAEGTTITLMVPQAFPTGFGRAMVANPPADPESGPWPPYDPGSPVEDPQRGELLFELVDTSGVSLSPRVFLPVRYITRVFPHVGSEGSITQNSFSDALAEGQTIAILDIPENTVPTDGDYQIKVRRFRRMASDIHAFEHVTAQTSQSEEWFGWGQDTVSPGGSPDPIPIRILDSTGLGFTPKSGWTDFAGGGLSHSDVTEELDELVPFPDFRITAKPLSPPGPPPAAWQVEISYPRKIIRIESVTSRNTTSGSAVVTWSADQTGTVDCTAADDTLRIQVLDPDQTTRSVRVSFSLQNFADTCGRRAAPADFQWGAFQAFDANGGDATSTYTILISSDPATFN